MGHTVPAETPKAQQAAHDRRWTQVLLRLLVPDGGSLELDGRILAAADFVKGSESKLMFPCRSRPRGALPGFEILAPRDLENTGRGEERVKEATEEWRKRSRGVRRVPADADQMMMMMDKRDEETLEEPAADIPLPFSAQSPSTFLPPGGTFLDADGADRGFLELLGLQELHQPSFLFQQPAATATCVASAPPAAQAESSDAVNFPANASSMSCSSTEAGPNPTKPATAGEGNEQDDEKKEYATLCSYR
ncbi:hypothetical protein GW17_00008411 [Ensete ventricosum]|nr:hypothetical protein GW17_00008411 [Ensete ventricosum]